MDQLFMNAARLCAIAAVLFAGKSFAASESETVNIVILAAVDKSENSDNVTVPNLQAIDVLISSAVSRHDNIRVLSRELMDMLMQEKTLDMAGLSSEQKKQWIQFKASGAILCPYVTVDKEGKKSALRLEIIAAQNGQCINETSVSLEKKDSTDWAEIIGSKIGEMLKKLPDDSSRLLGSMLLEVTVTADVGMKHAYWRCEPLLNSVDATLSKLKYVTLLKPRQPQATLEERILRVMGLTDADQSGHSSLVYLKPTPAGRLDIMFSEKPEEGCAIDDFEIIGNVVMKNDGNVVYEKNIKGKIGKFGEFQKLVCSASLDAAEALRKRLANAGDDRNSLAVQQSLEEMNAIKEFTGQIQEEFADSQKLTRTQKAEMGRRSMRAWNLDPCNEYAAYIACISYRWTFPGSNDPQYGDTHGPEARKETARLIHKYIEQFNEANPKHLQSLEYLRTQYGWRISRWEYFDAMKNLGLLEMKYGDFFYPEMYQSFLYALKCYMQDISIKNIHEEYQRWKDFYFNIYYPLWCKAYKSGKINKGIYYFWELVEAEYYFRLNQHDKVKEILQKAADKYPSDDKYAWGEMGDTKYFLDMIIGCSDSRPYEGWKLKFHASQPVKNSQQVFVEKLREFCLRVNKPNPEDISQFLPEPIPLRYSIETLPAIDCTSDAQTRKYSLENSVQPIGVINGKYWLYVSPVMHDRPNLLYDNCLAVGPNLDNKASEGDGGRLIELPWPAYSAPEDKVKKPNGQKANLFHITAYWVQPGKSDGNFTVWAGTLYHGVARWRYRDGKITDSRWFTSHDGFLSNRAVSDIIPAKYRGNAGLLVCSTDSSSQYGMVLFFLDYATDKIVLLKKHIGQFCKLKSSSGREMIFPFTLFNVTSTIFSSNYSLCSWGDLIRNTWADILCEDIGDMKIENCPAYYSEISFAVHHGKDKISWIGGNIAGMLDAKYSKIFTLNLLDMDAGRDNKRMGIYMPRNPTAIIGTVENMSNCGGTIVATAWRREKNTNRRVNYSLFLWQPGKDNAFVDDKWYGPFSMEYDWDIVNIFPGDKSNIWLIDKKNGNRHLKVNIDELIDIAKSHGNVFTTLQQMDKFLLSIRGDWRVYVRGLAGNGRPAQAVGILDGIIAENAKKHNVDYFDALILKAAVYAKNEDAQKKALEIYEKILKEADGPEYKFLAGKSAGMICYNLKDYAQAIKYLSGVRKFPEVAEMWKNQADGDAMLFHLFRDSESNYYLEKSKREVHAKLEPGRRQ